MEELPFQEIVDAVPDAVIVARMTSLDEPGPEVVYVNPAWEKMTGYDAAEVVGTVPDIAQGLWSSKEVRSQLREIFDIGRTYRRKIENVRKDGTKYWVEIRVSALGAETGRPLLLAVERDISEEVQLKADAKRLGTTDPLTGLMSRKAWMAEAERAWQLRVRYKRPWSLVLIDLDGYGAFAAHTDQAASAAVVRGVGNLLDEIARVQDIVGRYNTDDFAVLLPETDLDEARTFGERMRRELSNRVFEGHQFTASVSVVFPGSDRSLSETLTRLELGLGAARKRGGNTVVIA